MDQEKAKREYEQEIAKMYVRNATERAVELACVLAVLLTLAACLVFWLVSAE